MTAPVSKCPAARPKPRDALLAELRGLIDAARQHGAQTAHATLTMLYWHVGERIRREVLQDQRAEYGEQIVSTLSTQLVREYGQSFGLRSLRRMVQFAEVFPDKAIVATLSQELSWSHFVEFATGEPAESAVISILESSAADGKSYATRFYNLDAVVAVDCRVNSGMATHPRSGVVALHVARLKKRRPLRGVGPAMRSLAGLVRTLSANIARSSNACGYCP